MIFRRGRYDRHDRQFSRRKVDQAQAKLRELASAYGITPEELLRASIEDPCRRRIQESSRVRPEQEQRALPMARLMQYLTVGEVLRVTWYHAPGHRPRNGRDMYQPYRHFGREPRPELTPALVRRPPQKISQKVYAVTFVGILPQEFDFGKESVHKCYSWSSTPYLVK